MKSVFRRQVSRSVILATAKGARYVLTIIRRPFSDGIFPYTIAA
ncbi:Hypothetical protein NGK_1841 [Neisseria gonorrhoeae NCCP11945]|uniref:Uncharacterized protein n=1 Tax=Neisseria gonorrhoeae (strain NCCP11945) TaxID=521006 RepID=B4RQE5_NEIG2|nr:Hypothetical protein NGK_1841 [Neisseria gonorrhoeae NCCP11945]